MWVLASQKESKREEDIHLVSCDKSCTALGKEGKKKGSEEKSRPTLPCTYILPWCRVVGLPLNLSRDKAVQGIIHLPVPFSISSSLAGTFCPPLKHKIPSVRNRRTHSPLHSFSTSSLNYKCTTGKQRGWCCRETGEGDKLRDGKRTERCFGSRANISDSGKEMSKEKI